MRFSILFTGSRAWPDYIITGVSGDEKVKTHELILTLLKMMRLYENEFSSAVAQKDQYGPLKHPRHKKATTWEINRRPNSSYILYTVGS